MDKLKATQNPFVARTPAYTASPMVRRFVLWAAAVLGIGFILPNAAVFIVLAYVLSTFTLASQQLIIQMTGTMLFLIASLLIIILGILIINWGIRYYTNSSSRETIFVGVVFASFYLLCLGIGSALLAPQLGMGELLLIISPVLIMISVALYTVPTFPYRALGGVLGVVSAVALAAAMFYLQPLKLVFVIWNSDWENIPFLGPFMSLGLSEGMVVILGSVAALVHSISSGQKTKPASYAMFSIIGLVYGISLFIGTFLLSFSLLNIVWKAPWLPPLNGQPAWIFGIVIFWSASLIILEIGAFLLIASSCLGFVAAAKEFSKLSQT